MSRWKGATVKEGTDVSAFIKEVSRHIGGDWKGLARTFQLSKTDIDAIEHDHRLSLKEQIEQLFIKWQMQEGPLDATPAALLKALLDSELDYVLGKLIEKGFIQMPTSPVTAQPIQEGQTSPTLYSHHPVQEDQESITVHPIQECEQPPTPPRLIGGAAGDIEADKVIDNVTNKPKTIKSSPLTREDKERQKLRNKRLARLEFDKTGEGPFEEGSMIMVDVFGYGVVRWLGMLNNKFVAGIEFENRVSGGGDGEFQNEAYFSCDHGHGLFLPYEKLKGDDRFGDTNNLQSIISEPSPDHSPMNTHSNKLSVKPSVNTGNEEQTFENIFRTFSDAAPVEDQCKYPGCKKQKYIEDGKKLDFCGKTHADMFNNQDTAKTDTPQRPLVFYVPEDHVGLVIGKDGKNIREVERVTDTVIQVPPLVTGGRRTGVIIGSEENCKRAALMISEKLQRRVSQRVAASQQIRVPDDMVGRIIGKNGATIHAIKALSGAHDIDFSERPTGLEAFLNPMRVCTITGSNEEIEKAKDLIKQVLEGEDIVTNARMAALIVKLRTMGIDFDSSENNQCVLS